jgi:hypothetical protein
MSVQEAAVASQKFTCPSMSVVAPACTVAVNVTTVPPATEDTALPPEVRERVVALAWAARTGSGPAQQARQAIASAQRNERLPHSECAIPLAQQYRQFSRIFVVDEQIGDAIAIAQSNGDASMGWRQCRGCRRR